MSSPIEEKMLEAFERRDGGNGRASIDDLLAAEGLPVDRVVAVFEKWAVLREVTVDRYRLDFAVVGGCVSAWTIAVECDGHQFHERTKDQAAHDRRRDRFLLRNGWRVMRFTGSEIFRDAQGCVDEVIDLANALQERSELDFANWIRMYERGGR